MPTAAAAAAPSSAAAVLRLALLSRLIITSLILISRLLFHPYDTSSLLNPPCLSSDADTDTDTTPPVLFPRIGAAIERSVVWDSVYFIRIAECGYEYEQTYAFMPLLPACISILSRSVLKPLVPAIGFRAVLAVSGYVVNNVAFVLAVWYFYRLSVLLLKDSEAAMRAAVLFSFNPASIFYSSIYSESLYAVFSLGGLFYLYSGANTLAMLLLALSGSGRSNGALNAGYFCFQALLQAYDAIVQKKKASVAVQAIVVGGARSVFIFMPFIAFQAYGYLNICRGSTSARMPSPWCEARLPNLYGYLQSHYWGVGFLKYFQVKQLPNFLLASPILFLSVCSIITYMRYLPWIFHSLVKEQQKVDSVLHSPGENSTPDAIFPSKYFRSEGRADGMVRQRKRESSNIVESVHYPEQTGQEAIRNANQGYHTIFVLPFILHLGFITFMAFFVMHVQVATRFLSASPSIYWFASYVLSSSGRTRRRLAYLIWVYFVTYSVLGTLLFSNFYPFT